jgi:hypothetical protein
MKVQPNNRSLVWKTMSRTHRVVEKESKDPSFKSAKAYQEDPNFGRLHWLVFQKAYEHEIYFIRVDFDYHFPNTSARGSSDIPR